MLCTLDELVHKVGFILLTANCIHPFYRCSTLFIVSSNFGSKEEVVSLLFCEQILQLLMTTGHPHPHTGKTWLPPGFTENHTSGGRAFISIEGKNAKCAA